LHLRSFYKALKARLHAIFHNALYKLLRRNSKHNILLNKELSFLLSHLESNLTASILIIKNMLS